jgi:hypothetical protein
MPMIDQLQVFVSMRSWSAPLSAVAVRRALSLYTGDTLMNKFKTALAGRSPLNRVAFSGLMVLTLLLSMALLQPAWADPPSRVARVAELSGEAWVFDPDDKAWVPVSRNQTIAEGDRLRTERDARVSLRIGSTSLWLNERSDLEFTRLDEDRLDLLLDKGELGLRLRSQESASETSVQTREGLIRFERDGVYRVDQLARGARGLVWSGQLRFESRSGDVPPVWVASNEQAEFWWANGPRTERSALMRDDFGDWLQAQSRNEGEAQAYRYVSPEMTGAEVLDGYGRWDQSGEYGAIWIPYQVAPNWAPYRYGHWAWTRHWGWAWVDDAPWGFAPFHYGRWVQLGGRWCWAPGRYIARPIYAPALVNWGRGPSVSIGIQIGGSRPPPPRAGWVPLAPREHYAPIYRHSPDYINRVNAPISPVTGGRPQQPQPHDPRPPGAGQNPGKPPGGHDRGDTPQPQPQPQPQPHNPHEQPVPAPRPGQVPSPSPMPVPVPAPTPAPTGGRPGMNFGRPAAAVQAEVPAVSAAPQAPSNAAPVERPRDRSSDERANERNNDRNSDRNNDRNRERPRVPDAAPARPVLTPQPAAPQAAPVRQPGVVREENKGENKAPQRAREESPKRRDERRDERADR